MPRTPAPGPGEHHLEDEGEPVKGGTLVYGLEADTANAWAAVPCQPGDQPAWS